MSAPTKRKILLVYAALNYPLRANTKHLIECFRRYGDAHWFYLNLAHKSSPSYISDVAYDLVIFQTTFTQRLSRSEKHFEQMMRRAARLRELPSPKVALVQDEFWNAARVERFINVFGVEKVFSVAPESEWPKIYPNVDRSKTVFHRVLTGYLDDDELRSVVATGDNTERPRDIVYRAAGKPSPAWGRFGYLKQNLADAVRKLAPRAGLKTDISTDQRDALYGDDWTKFLASARYIIGAPSGASLLDRDGAITRKVDAYLACHPGASFEETEAHCFPGLDGNLDLSAIGPRHIEACATRTCQILVEGDYNGLLQPGIHYIAVKSDLSDLNDVLSTLGDEDRRCAIVERAFDDVVRPMKITYGNFVRVVLDQSFRRHSGLETPMTVSEARVMDRMMRTDFFEWRMARMVSKPLRWMRDKLGYLGMATGV